MHRTTHSALRTATFAAVLALWSVSLAANQLEDPIDIDLEKAGLHETLESFAAISGAQLDLAAGVEGTVSIHMEKSLWPAVLDRICRDHELNCEMLPGEPLTLRVRPADLAASYPSPPGFAEPISLSLKGADLRETLGYFGAISGSEIIIDDDVDGTVTLNVESAPWTIMLEELCRLSGCEVVWDADPIRIRAAETDEAMRLDMALRAADLHQMLSFFSRFPILGSEGPKVEIDPSLTSDLTVDFEQASWRQALDLVCEQVGCRWRVVYGDPPVLKVEVPKSDGAGAGATVEEPGAAAKRLSYRFSAPGAAAVEGTARFTWADPIHEVSRGDYRARLNWIPFGPELSVILPLIERCEASLASVAMMDPSVLPLLGEVRHQAEGVVLDLAPAAGEAVSGPPAAKAGASCGPPREGRIHVTMRRLVDGESDRPRPKRLQFVESYLLVRPVEASRPVAAVIALGADLDGRQGLALLRAAEDRRSVEMETLSLALDEHAEKIVHDGGHSYELRIEYSQSDPRNR